MPELDLGYPMKPGQVVRPPLVTVGERGGDDTLHRIVLLQDVWLGDCFFCECIDIAPTAVFDPLAAALGYQFQQHLQ